MKIFSSVCILLTVFFIGCTGPAGPQGPVGPQGTNILGQTIERTVNFTPSNGYGALVTFEPLIYDSDAILVYVLEGVDEFNNPIWRQLPRRVLFAFGTMNYEYDFTKNDVRLFLDANFDLSMLESKWTLNQTFRIVVVPSDFARKMAKASYKQVSEALKLEDKDFKTTP